ncbi:MAG: malto-oligosyltrehalose trehalohydrolase [Hymenobacteraceae bacterium]|nr:malto-oligosyltrehalose trehalohydrolase [Hymenobacteraceae bacterium]MDX5396400.1 malto-oligosyltrehalose trehalohydrolase [Hymenobacteraceae bacterium]MDX5512462.1 malto-oligosyltrehalose trehalohydrolase [Hymenobacteraceae bacterium]
MWAPEAKQVRLQITAPEKQQVEMQPEEQGYWVAELQQVQPGTKYFFKLDDKPQRPDPASLWQPEGVHKASAVVNHHEFNWTDSNWQVFPLEQMIIYELHIGTFTDEGTFEAAIEKIPYLKELGVNTIELMPVAQFPGSRNWGYDGVYPFAAQQSYGGPDGLKKLINACHEQELAVVLDVVYNHMGPEGNYLNDFGPYFTDKYHTPWGKALNFDDAFSDPVRNFFIQNALMWLRDYHFDGLRLDAVHAIFDTGAKHILQELAEQVRELEHQTKKTYYLIAESDLNDVRVVLPKNQGGFGMDGQWSDDFHHALHTVATGESDGYYADFGKLEQLQQAMQNTFVYNGRYSSHRHKTFGNDATHLPAKQFVVCSQNHDQVGNRMLGERLSELVSADMLKVVAATVLLSPYVSMLFMGEEYAEPNPFLYFVSHSDKELIKAVREGRKREFKAFAWQGEAPDPQAEETFERSKLSWIYEKESKNRFIWQFYKQLIQLRKEHPVLQFHSKKHLKTTADAAQKLLIMERWNDAGDKVICYFNFGDKPAALSLPDGNWQVLLNSSDEKWGGSGGGSAAEIVAESVVVFEVSRKGAK